MKIKLGHVFGVALLLEAVTVHAQSTTDVPPPTPPVLTCNQNSVTPGVFKDLKDVFTTAAPGYTYVAGTVSHTYTNSNQGYWQVGVEKRAKPGGNGRTDGTTGSRNNAGPTLGSTIPNSPPGTDPIGGFYDPYPTLPTMDGGWVVLGNDATSGYNKAGSNWQLVGMGGAIQLNRNPNVMYYYKFTFTMDPLMDLSKFSINIPTANGQWGADDRIKGIYVNGQLVGTTNDPAATKNNNVISTNGKLSFSPTSSAYTAGLNVGGQGSLPTNASWAANNPNPVWKTGINEVVFATMNGGVRDATNVTDVNFGDSTGNNAAGGYPGSNSGMNTSLTLLKILGASPVQDCTVPPPAVSAPNPIPVSTSADPLVFTGTVTNYGSATTVNVTVTDASGTVVGTFPAQIDPATGKYLFTGTGPSGLPPGNYTTNVTLVNPLNPTGPGLAVNGTTPFTITAPAITLTPPANIAAGTANVLTGTVPNKGAATTVDLVLKDASGNVVGTFNAVPIQANGSYTVPSTGNLLAGAYTVDATITGVSGTIAHATGSFVASTVSVTPPPTHTTTEPSPISGHVQFPGSATSVHVTVTDASGAKVFDGDVPIDAAGNYQVPLGALPAGPYNITSSVNGASATGSFNVVQTGVTVAPLPTVNSKEISHITGTVTNPGTATTVDVKVTDSTGKVVWQGPAPLKPNGTYAVDTAMLPQGNYTVTASVNGGTATTPLKVVDPQITVTAPPNVTPDQAATISGTVTQPGTATTVDLKITDSTGAVVWQGSATLNPDGTYSTPATPLPVGNYQVTATVNGISATTSFAVAVASAGTATAVPTLSEWSLALLSMVLVGLGLRLKRRDSVSKR